jgi:hypothetical protein
MRTRDRHRSGSRTQPLRSCSWPIEQLPGLSQEDQTRLQNQGIHTTFQLLQQGATPAQKQRLAGQLQIHVQHVNKWVALADLARIPSVGCQYCGLLLHAGVASCVQLAQTPLHRLHPQLLRLQVAMMQRPDLCPPVEAVAIWMQQARSLTASSILRSEKTGSR